MAPIFQAIERKVRRSHHVVFSETREGSVATRVSNFNTEKVDYQQLLQMQVLVPRLERLLDSQVTSRVIGCLWMYTAEI